MANAGQNTSAPKGDPVVGGNDPNADAAIIGAILGGNKGTDTPAPEPASEPAAQADTPKDDSLTKKVAEDLRGGEPVKPEDDPAGNPVLEAIKKDDDTDPAKEPAEPKKDEPGVISDWDAPKEPAKEPDNQVDYKQVSAFLGIDGDTKEAVFGEVEAMRDKIKEYESGAGAPQFANSVIADANEIAAKGGNWMEFLGASSLDYGSMSDEDVVKNEYKKLMGDKLTQEDIDNLIVDKSASQLQIDAESARQRQSQHTSALKGRMEREAQENIERVNSGLKEALGKVNDVAGFAIKDGHKAELFNDLTTGQGFAQMFFLDENGGYDFGKITTNALKIKHFDNMVNYLRTNGTNEGKRQVMDNLRNVDKALGKDVMHDNGGKKAESRTAIEGLMSAMKGGNR